MSRQSETTPPEAIGMDVGRACFCIGVFFALLLLFNGAAMYESAGHLAYGPVRDFWMSVLRPVERVSRMSGLCHARGWTQATAGEWLNQMGKE